MRIKNLLTVCFLLVAASVEGSNYLWPTNASRLLTSSFCEFRPRHFHAAIDIKTWNQTGYRAFAVQDGHVMRVRVSAVGYGKAVYLKLKDGNIAVYAHLERFFPALEEYVNRIRTKQQKYRVDLFLTSDQFPVKQGQVVGYTGSTGIGVPHLHFEIRDKQNRPINPLAFYTSRVKDRIAPRLQQIAFVPLSPSSLINQSPDTLIRDLGLRSRSELPDTLLFCGKIGIALKSYDRAQGAPNRFAFYRAQMLVDDSLVYSIQYDTFSYAQTALIELDKNFSLWRRGFGIFHNFFRHPANRLHHYRHTATNAGILDSEALSPGSHHLQIRLEDFHGNSAMFSMHFRSGRTAPLACDLFRRLDGDLFLRIQSPIALDRVNIFTESKPGDWNLLPDTRLLGQHSSGQIHYYTLSIPTPNAPLKVLGIAEDGFPTLPLFLNQPDAEDSLRLENWRVKGNYLEFSLFDPRPVYSGFYPKHLGLPAGTLWFPRAPYRGKLLVPLAATSQLPRFFYPTWDTVTSVNPARPALLASTDGLFSARFPAGAFYEQTTAALFLMDGGDALPPPDPAYKRFGWIYDLQPFDQPVKNKISISLSAPDSLQNVPGLALYYWDAKKGWLFLPAEHDSARRTFTAPVTSLEKFTLIQDTIAPLLLPAQKIVADTLRSRNGYLTFLLKDEMAGIYHESQIRVTVDGNWHLFVYDPEENLLIIKIPQDSAAHNLIITVADNCGNSAVQNYVVR